MKPKVGEPILIGVMRTIKDEEINPFVEGGVVTRIRGGDRSYTDGVWVCVSSEDDRCIIRLLLQKGKKPRWVDFGAVEPRMIMYEDYPISKCSEETLRVMTGYTYSDDLISAINSQILTESSQ